MKKLKVSGYDVTIIGEHTIRINFDSPVPTEEANKISMMVYEYLEKEGFVTEENPKYS